MLQDVENDNSYVEHRPTSRRPKSYKNKNPLQVQRSTIKKSIDVSTIPENVPDEPKECRICLD